MKVNKRIELLESQKILFQTKRRESIALIQATQNGLNKILDMVMIEQGIPEKEINQWRLTADGEAFEKMESKEPPENKGKKKR